MKSKSTQTSNQDEFLVCLEKYKRAGGQSFFLSKDTISILTENSTKIEGSTLSLEEVTNVLHHGRHTSKPKKHEKMVKDCANAIYFTSNLYRDKKPLTIPILEYINFLVMRNNGELEHIPPDWRVVDTSSGKVREHNVYWKQHQFLNPEKLNDSLRYFLDDIKTYNGMVKNELDVYNLSFLIHYNLITIHPFADGNSRTSRILMNYIQGYHNQPLTTVLAKDWKAYKDSLLHSWDEQKMEPFYNFIFQHTIEFFKYATQKLIKSKEEKKTPIKWIRTNPNALTSSNIKF